MLEVFRVSLVIALIAARSVEPEVTKVQIAPREELPPIVR